MRLFLLLNGMPCAISRIHVADDRPSRYLEEMARQLSRTDEIEWRSCIEEPEDDPRPMSSRTVKSGSNIVGCS